MFVSLEATIVYIFIVLYEGTTVSLSLGDLVFKHQVNSLLIRSLGTTGADARASTPTSTFHTGLHSISTATPKAGLVIFIVQRTTQRLSCEETCPVSQSLCGGPDWPIAPGSTFGISMEHHLNPEIQKSFRKCPEMLLLRTYRDYVLVLRWAT